MVNASPALTRAVMEDCEAPLDTPSLAGVEAIPAAGASEQRMVRTSRRAFVVFGGYLAVSLWLWHHLLPHLATHALGGGVLDPGIFVWWLKWTPYALAHGLDPFRTSFIDAPNGVSAMWNTSVIALGVLFAPVTFIFGPVASFNVACILASPLSALTAWMWLRRYTRDVAAAIGGLIFGFSPFVIAHSDAGHLNLMWLALLPIVAMLVEDILWRVPTPSWRRGVGLGVVVVVQLLIGSEALLIAGMTLVLLALLLAAVHPRAVRQRVRAALPASAAALVTAGLLGAWPLLEQFGGSRAIRDPVAPIGSSGGLIGMLVAAPHFLHFHHHYGAHGPLNSVEDGLFVGWPLLALLAVTVIVVRNRRVLIAAAILVVSVAFQMYGKEWHILSHAFTAPLASIQETVSITSQIRPGRFGMVMWLAIAFLVAQAADVAIARLRRGCRLIALVTIGLCLVPLIPVPEAHTPSTPITPQLFTTSLRHIIPPGATVLIAPMPAIGDSAPELWQIDTGMRFHELGGYMLHASGAGGAPSYGPDQRALALLFTISLQTGLPYEGPITAPLLEQARAELRAARVSMVIVGYSRYGVSRQLDIARQLLARPPDEEVGGTWIWRTREHD